MTRREYIIKYARKAARIAIYGVFRGIDYQWAKRYAMELLLNPPPAYFTSSTLFPLQNLEALTTDEKRLAEAEINSEIDTIKAMKEKV